jgi:hypothetical protein
LVYIKKIIASTGGHINQKELDNPIFIKLYQL